MNRGTFISTILFAASLFADVSRADAPATEFFAIETAKLVKLAPTDAVLDTLSSGKLSELSTAHGWYDGGLMMRFSTEAFRLDARFTDGVGSAGRGPDSIGYHITAGMGQKTWNVLREDGTAIKQGKQFITKDWRNQPVVVILRFLDLKH
jgi:hypothetical protein